MTHEELLKHSTEFGNRPSVLHDFIFRQQEHAPFFPNQPPPSWCKRTLCNKMPSAKERKCCGRRNCVTKDRTFYDIGVIEFTWKLQYVPGQMYMSLPHAMTIEQCAI